MKVELSKDELETLLSAIAEAQAELWRSVRQAFVGRGSPEATAYDSKLELLAVKLYKHLMEI